MLPYKNRIRFLSLLMVVLLVCGLPSIALAGDAGTEHIHDSSCGYVEAVEGQPCRHVHDELCGYSESAEEIACNMECADTDGDGAADHAEECAYTPAAEGTPCGHVHDEMCGFVEAVEGQPCQYKTDAKTTPEDDDTELNEEDTKPNEDDTEQSEEYTEPDPDDTGSSEEYTEPDSDDTGSSEEDAEPDEDDTELGEDEDANGEQLQLYEVSTEAEFREAAAAINEAPVGQYVISLQNDIALTGDSGVELSANETTILGNGYTLSWDGTDDSQAKHSLLVASGSTTVLNFGTPEGSNILLIDGNLKDSKSAMIQIRSGARLNMYAGTTIQNVFRQSQGSALGLENAAFNMYGGTITKCSNKTDVSSTNLQYRGSAIYAISSVIHMYGGEICDNQTDCGGVIYLKQCSFTLHNGRIANNKSGYSGGAISATEAEVNLLGGEICDNSCNMRGGGVYAVSSSTVYLNGTTLTGNNAGFEGGAFALQDKNTTLVMDSGLIKNNTASSGAGIYLNYYAYARMNGGEITENSANSGAALYLMSSAAADIYGGSISKNAGVVSGALFIWGSTVNLYDGTISENTATAAAAVEVWLGSALNIFGGSITNNVAQEGGTIDLYGNLNNTTCVLNMSGGSITNNTAGFGGAILSTSATINIDGGYITDNHAVESLGGGIYSQGATILNIGENAHLYNNTAARGGDDIYFVDELEDSRLEPAALKLNDTFHDAKLAECGDQIVGWYADGLIDKEGTPRWNTHDADEELYFVELSETGFQKSIALKAAHGLIGDVSVSKTVKGNADDADREFSFRMVLSDTRINGTYGDLTFENGAASFTLKDGETKTARGIPAEITYSVTEADYSEEGYTAAATGDTGKIVSNETAAAAFANTYTDPDVPPIPEIKKGSLTVSKVVEGNAGNQTEEFPFTVTLSDPDINGTYGDMVFANGIAAFSLKHCESKTAAGLPAGIEYTVAEGENDGYTVTVNGTDNTEASGKIEPDMAVTAVFTNHKDHKEGGYSLPETGGIGTQPFTVGGALLLSGCLFHAGMTRYKRERKHS